MESERNHKWQHRILERTPSIDYSQNKVGDEVVVETAKLVECPGCHQPAVAVGAETSFGQTVMFIHKRDGGELVEICIGVPLDRPDLIMMDKDGNEVYSGPANIPDEKKN